MALLRYVSLPALLLGSIAPDIQPFIIMFFNQPGTLHGSLTHSFIGSTTLLALPITAIVFILRKPLQAITTPLKLNQKQTFLNILAGTLIGLYSHILLDATLYPEMQPLYPLTQNPLLSHDPNRYYLIYTACAATFIIALAIYAVLLREKHKTQPPTPASKK